MNGWCFEAFPFLLFYYYDTESLSFSESFAFIKVDFDKFYMMRCLLFGFGFFRWSRRQPYRGWRWSLTERKWPISQLFSGQDAVSTFLPDAEWVQEIINIFETHKTNLKLTKQHLQLYSDFSFLCLFFVTFLLFCIFTFPVFIFSLNPHLPSHFFSLF